MKIHVNDNVMVIAGKDRGKTGLVRRVMEKKQQVTVEKVNIRTRHIKKRPGQPGQKIHYEASINSSNVMVVCPNCSKPTRVGHVVLKDSKRQRVCKKCNQSLEKPFERQRTKKK